MSYALLARTSFALGAATTTKHKTILSTHIHATIVTPGAHLLDSLDVTPFNPTHDTSTFTTAWLATRSHPPTCRGGCVGLAAQIGFVFVFASLDFSGEDLSWLLFRLPVHHYPLRRSHWIRLPLPVHPWFVCTCIDQYINGTYIFLYTFVCYIQALLRRSLP